MHGMSEALAHEPKPYAAAQPRDWVLLALLCVHGLLWLPLIARSTENPQKLAAFINDEPVITQQLVGMSMRPYGNPANLLRDPWRAPQYWGYLTYPNNIYYGGFYLDAAFAIYYPLKKCLGLDDFPLAPISLRLISALSGMLALALTYLLARRLGGRLAGLGAGLLLATDLNFAAYTSIIHPDTTMLALALLTLFAAIRHAESGSLGSLAGTGILAGVVHGTKMGGPWLIPMAVVALVWGVRTWSNSGVKQFMLTSAGRLVMLGGCAAIGFFGSTPYALFDPYYFNMVRGNTAFFTSSPWTEAKPLQWLAALWEYLGIPLSLLTLHGFAGTAVCWARGDQAKPFVLSALLALSCVAWYSTMIRLWVCVPYLLTALALFYVLGAVFAARGIACLQAQGRPGYLAGALVIVIATGSILSTRGIDLATAVVYAHQLDQTTGVLVGRWAEENLPHDSKILFDDAAYFDPTVFPNAVLHNGLMTYGALEAKQPDYFLLSGSIYEAPHYVELRKTQAFTRGKEGNFSVLLYQDLLDRDGSPEVRLIHVIRPKKPMPSNWLEQVVALTRQALGVDTVIQGPEIRVYQYMPGVRTK
jgi:hypothetical protein